MKQIDKLAWIEIKDKKYFSTEALEKNKYTFWKKKRIETDLEALTREIKRLQILKPIV
jgi:hypothetical protein